MTFLTAMIILAMLATVGALAAGVVSMAHGREFDQNHSTQLMAARVVLQGVTLVLLLVALILA